MDLLGNLLKNIDVTDIAQKFGFDAEEVQKIVGALGNNEEVQKAIPNLVSQQQAQQQGEQQANPEEEKGGFDLSSLNMESIFSSLSEQTGVNKEKLSTGGSGLIGAVLSKLTGGQGGLSSLLNAENLTAMLDKDGDGKITDDLLDAAKGFLSKKS